MKSLSWSSSSRSRRPGVAHNCSRHWLELQLPIVQERPLSAYALAALGVWRCQGVPCAVRATKAPHACLRAHHLLAREECRGVYGCVVLPEREASLTHKGSPSATPPWSGRGASYAGAGDAKAPCAPSLAQGKEYGKMTCHVSGCVHPELPPDGAAEGFRLMTPRQRPVESASSTPQWQYVQYKA